MNKHLNADYFAKLVSDQNPHPGEYRIEFGKFKGQKLKDIAKENKPYLWWLFEKGDISDQFYAILSDFLT